MRLSAACIAVAVLSACQPQARRLLLLDLQLTDPAIIGPTTQPWHEAGYTVEYRRFYPHLTRSDLARYRTVVILGGAQPEGASDALAAGDLALLDELVDGGGVAVLGYPDAGEGFADRWVLNRWLAWRGAGLVIGDFVLHDTLQRAAGAFDPQPYVDPLGGSALREADFDPFPAGRNHVLLTDHEAQVLARATLSAFVRPPGQPPSSRRRAAVVAASRVGQGIVVVLSRDALGALGPGHNPSTTPLIAARLLDQTRAFLVTLARWTRRPAEWARIPEAGARGRLALMDGPRPVAAWPPRLAPPGGAEAMVLPTVAGSQVPRRPASPGWIGRAGLRLLWGGRRFTALKPTTAPSVRGRALDSLIAFLDVGAFTALSADGDAAAIAESARAAPWEAWERDATRNTWKQVFGRLETTSLRWVPAITPATFRVPVDSTSRVRGADSTASWCGLDPHLWTDGLAAYYRALARLAAAQPDVVPAIALDLDGLARTASPGAAYCDAAWRAGLAALPRDSVLTGERAERLSALPIEVRYDSLREGGLLRAYLETLERLVANRAAVIRADGRRFRPDLSYAFVSARLPGDWFTLGLIRGFSSSQAPALLWTPDPWPGDWLTEARGRGIFAVHAVGLDPSHIPATAWPSLGRILFGESDGFWLADAAAILAGPRGPGGPLPADSLGRLVRRLSKER